MIAYLDSNVILGLLVADSLQLRAEAAVSAWPGEVVFSDLGAVEFASVIARRVRTGDTSAALARFAFDTFDAWADAQSPSVSLLPVDLAAASTYLRGLDLNLRAPDAIHIAIAQRLGATLLTFDARMREAAEALGCKVFAG